PLGVRAGFLVHPTHHPQVVPDQRVVDLAHARAAVAQAVLDEESLVLPAPRWRGRLHGFRDVAAHAAATSGAGAVMRDLATRYLRPSSSTATLRVWPGMGPRNLAGRVPSMTTGSPWV